MSARGMKQEDAVYLPLFTISGLEEAYKEGV